MFCAVCRNEIIDCVCPDIEERLSRLKELPATQPVAVMSIMARRVKELEAENKRLREALEKIRDAKPGIRDTISEFSGTPAFYYVPPAPTKLQEIARQALEGGSG